MLNKNVLSKNEITEEDISLPVKLCSHELQTQATEIKLK
jgi:hypothetical protein